MALYNAAVTVDTTAGGIVIWTPPVAGGTKFGLVVMNNGSVNIAVGSATVATLTYANGMILLPGTYLTLDDVQDTVRGIAQSSSADVRYFAWGKP